jgi:probable HAF family extracellular repeat protein
MNTKRTITLSGAILTAALISAKPSEAATKPILKFTNITVPGWVYPGAFGINNEGVIVGNCDQLSSPPIQPGFIDRGGDFTLVILPADVAGGAPNPAFGVEFLGELEGINDAGTAIGEYTDADGVFHPFLRHADGSITYLPNAVSGPDAVTLLNGINNHGVCVGSVWPDLLSTEPPTAFVLEREHYTLFDLPNATETSANGINDQNEIVGWYFDATGYEHAFLKRGEVYTSFNVPEVPGGAYPLGVGTFAFGINNRGQIVGEYYDDSGITHGFLLWEGVFTTVDFPGQELTGNALQSINDHGEAVGTYDNGGGAFSVKIVWPGEGEKNNGDGH